MDFNWVNLLNIAMSQANYTRSYNRSNLRSSVQVGSHLPVLTTPTRGSPYRNDLDNFNVLRRYRRLKPLGMGGQGSCCSAFDIVTGKYVAIKKLSKPFVDPTQAKRALRELKLMKLVKHKNVIRMLNVFTPQNSLEDFQDVYIVTELMDATLTQAIQYRNLDHERISYLTYQILCGLKHLNSLGIIHRDLKPCNIVVKKDCSLKILDLGMARTIDDNTSFTMTPYVVTRYYRGPEVVLGMPYGPNLDMWSVGCIMGEMISGHVMFQGEDLIKMWLQMTNVVGTPSRDFIDTLQPSVRRLLETFPTYPGFSFERILLDSYFPPNSTANPELNADNARDLVSKMLVIDPRRRVTVDQALQHPYVKLWYRDDEVNSHNVRRISFGDLEDSCATNQERKGKIYKEVVEHKMNNDVTNF